MASAALPRFLGAVRSTPTPVLLDLGPAVGSNITFLGQELGCKIHVEDLYADLDRHVQQGALDRLPEFLATRFRLPDESADAVLCWDIVDYLDVAAAQALADQLMRVLRPDGALLAFFATVAAPEMRYTKYVIADEHHLRHRPYPAACRRQRVLENRDIVRLFDRLRVSDSFLLRSNLREVLFRKPGSATA